MTVENPNLTAAQKFILEHTVESDITSVAFMVGFDLDAFNELIALGYIRNPLGFNIFRTPAGTAALEEAREK